ncbi:MAG: PKD domain-containing protein, partial [Bacteroidota bacterium]
VGGSAVATDATNGNLLFYTDGANIYDASNAIMPSGTGLAGTTSANQPVAITKVPGQANQFYVFMNSANFTTGGTVTFRIVDMSLFGNAVFPNPALGNATNTTNTAVAGLTARSEAMIAVPHANRNDFWLITHANGTPDYSVTLINSAGPVTTTTFTGLGLIEVAANFSYHEATGRIATSPQETTRDVEIVNFNNSTGVLSFNQRVLNTGLVSTTNQALYDTEWSNNGQYLYISRPGEAGIQADVIQFDFANQLTSLVSVLPQPNTIARSYGLQMAPDSAIYHLYQATVGGPFLLGTLTNTDTISTEVVYDPSAFATNPNFLGTQFPSFAPKDTVMITVSFTAQGTCSNAPTSFFPSVKPAADSLIWRFGDGQSASEWSPVHTYTAGGTFNVRLTAFLNGDSAFVVQPVTITAFNLQLSLVQDTTACACELPVNNGQPLVGGGSCPNDTSDDMTVTVQAQGGSPTFQWFGPGGLLPGQTTSTLRPDSAGYYYVVATIGACSAYAGVNIKEYDSLDQRANIWYFGQNAGIDFNPLPNDPAVAISGPLNTPEGCAVICDRNGQVIFSTDGERIYDKDDVDITPAPVPPGLGGNPTSTQSALIMPVPGDETLFYIFTTQEIHGTNTYELRYSLFDLKQNNGQGGLAIYNQLLFKKSTERITGNENWLIAHEYGNNSFRAYQITPQGIGNPIISAIGSDHATTSAENGQGYMKLGAQGRLAVALSTPGVSNIVEIFDFVDSSGVVTNFRSVNLNSTAGQAYGVEFSPAGNKLFVTLKNATSRMYEYAFDTLGIPRQKQVVNQAGELGAMQIGPDGQIYVAINGSNSLGTFTANEDTTQISAITTLQPFALAGGTQSELGLPNFTQIIANPAQTPGITFAGVCVNSPTQFNGTGKDSAIDQFDWFFGDGQSAIDAGPQVNHTYTTPGTYTATLRVYNKCENPVATFTQQITINPLPPNPSAGVTMCTGAQILDANPSNLPGFTYLWSTGATTETITVNQQGIYTVTVTNAFGCTVTGNILAADNRPQVDFGANQTICENTPIFPLNAQNPGATYSWTINGAAAGTNQTQSVDTSVPDVFEYEVLITDPVTTCFVRDSIIYTIKESPVFTATPNGPIGCGATNGQITLNITAPASTLFSYFITGPSPGITGIDQPLGIVTTPATLAAGTYGITVSDQVSGCVTSTTASINTNAFTVAGVASATCDPIQINVTVTPTPGPLVAPFNYRVINNSTLAVVNTGSGGALTFTTNATGGLASNNQQYVVEVTNAGCVATSPPITINEAAKVQSTFTVNPCVNPITLRANGGTSWTWTGPNISGSNTLQQISANPPQGNQIYNVNIKQAGLCDLDTAITVNVMNNVTADFTQSDACADQVTLSATPTGSFTYRWYRNGVLTLGGQALVIGTADNNAQYRVEAVSTLSGCVFSSAQKAVQVAGTLDVTVTSTPPCVGSPFTLTATATQASATFAWALNSTTITGQTSATLVDERDGTYTVTASVPGCSVSEDIQITRAPLTAGFLTDTGTICPDPANPDPETREVVLDPGTEFLSYNWFKEEIALGITTPTYTATEAGNYSVDLINLFGCASSDKIQLIEDCTPRVTGPNAFRPGGLNKEFFIFTFFIADDDFQVFIFNRWGEMVYQSNDRQFRWNGGYNNNLAQPLPPGTYSYVVKFRSSYRPEEGIQEQHGGVVLLR